MVHVHLTHESPWGSSAVSKLHNPSQRCLGGMARIRRFGRAPVQPLGGEVATRTPKVGRHYLSASGRRGAATTIAWSDSATGGGWAELTTRPRNRWPSSRRRITSNRRADPRRRADRQTRRRGDETSESAGQGHEQQNQENQASKAAADAWPANIEPTTTEQNQQDDQNQQCAHARRLLRPGSVSNCGVMPLASCRCKGKRAVVQRICGQIAGFVAEGEGFEPPIRFPVQRFSRPPPSTTRPSLRTASSVSCGAGPAAGANLQFQPGVARRQSSLPRGRPRPLFTPARCFFSVIRRSLAARPGRVAVRRLGRIAAC